MNKANLSLNNDYRRRNVEGLKIFIKQYLFVKCSVATRRKQLRFQGLNQSAWLKSLHCINCLRSLTSNLFQVNFFDFAFKYTD